MSRQINQAGEKLILGFEKYVGYTYDDADTSWPRRRILPGDIVRGILTCGFGHTGPEAYPGATLTEDEALELFHRDITSCETFIDQWAPGLSDNQFAACCSLAYNIGLTAFHRSTLLRYLVAGDFDHAAAEFPKWDRSGGRELDGLEKRREAERELFLTPDEG